MSELKPVPTVHVDEISDSSVSWPPVAQRRFPWKKKLDIELSHFYSIDKVIDLL